MSKTTYTSISEVTGIETKIMGFVSIWVHKEKKATPLREIIKNMENDGVKSYTTIKALNSLVKKGYIRRGFEISNKTTFVQLRTI